MEEVGAGDLEDAVAEMEACASEERTALVAAEMLLPDLAAAAECVNGGAVVIPGSDFASAVFP